MVISASAICDRVVVATMIAIMSVIVFACGRDHGVKPCAIVVIVFVVIIIVTLCISAILTVILTETLIVILCNDVLLFFFVRFPFCFSACILSVNNSIGLIDGAYSDPLHCVITKKLKLNKKKGYSHIGSLNQKLNQGRKRNKDVFRPREITPKLLQKDGYLSFYVRVVTLKVGIINL